MYLLGRVGGYRYQARLWMLRERGALELIDLAPQDVDRVAELMAHYADQPMDLADASLVAAAERLQLRQIFTLDSQFHIYRLRDGTVLETMP
jgi:uncharacterized protein